MFNSIIKALSIKDLRNRIFFTCLCVVVFKFISLIPMPGVDTEVSKLYFLSLSGKMGDVFKMVNSLSGGAFSGMTLLALSISPYVSATIFVQIYTTLNGNIQRDMQVSPSLTRRRIGVMNRYVTLLLSVIQSASFARYALYINSSFPNLISPFFISHKMLFYFSFVVGMTSGTMVVMWLSDLMTQKGVGNGVSIIISTGILSSSYKVILDSLLIVFRGQADKVFFTNVCLFSCLFLLVLAWSILLSLGQLDIPVIYAKKVSGNRMIQGKGSPIIPLKVNYSGILPVMFASSAMMFVSTLAGFIQKSFVSSIFVPTSVPYIVFYISFVYGFSYLWTTIQFRPKQIASELKKNGAFIPGVKQGVQTEKYLMNKMHPTNLLGTTMLSVLALIPWMLERFLLIERTRSYLVGGTTILLLVGTVVDIFSQLSGYMAHYKQPSFSVKNKL